MNLLTKLLILYTGIRSLYSSIEYIRHFITIIQLPYTLLIQTYYVCTLIVFMYLCSGIKCIINNTCLFVMSVIQLLIGIFYLGLTNQVYMFILYDLFINTCILSGFMIYYNYSIERQLQDNHKIITNHHLQHPFFNSRLSPLDEYNSL